jgi:hypothetical protein
MKTKSTDQTTQEYVVVAPDGEHIRIPGELFGALQDFLQKNASAGSLTIHFRNGGIAGVEALFKKIYK